MQVIIHRQLSHVNIVQMIDYQCVNGRVCLILELCEVGDLDHLLDMRPSRLLPEPVCRRYFTDLVNALDYLHKHGIAHRDVACSNILVDRHNRAKLADFGDACHFDVDLQRQQHQQSFSGTCGSSGYQVIYNA